MTRFITLVVLGIACLFLPLMFFTLTAAGQLRVCANDLRQARVVFLDEHAPVTESQWSTWKEKLHACALAFYRWDGVYQAYRTYLPFTHELLSRSIPGWDEKLRAIKTYLPLTEEFIEHYPQFAGIGDERRYILVLQNNTELRPTGGFLGSFAHLVFRDGKLAEMKLDDIYNPDGQLQGYVEPPKPVADNLFQHGGWHLRDSNWNPNFPEAAQTMLWFFDRGGYHNVDGIGTITLSTMQDVLRLVGDIYLPDYDKTVSAESLYSFVQSETEQQFFPGASNKRDVLGALARAVFRKMKELPAEKQLDILDALVHRLNTKDIVFWMKDSTLQSAVEKHGWDGGIHVESCEEGRCRTDALYIVEANVGINKANCCIDRTAMLDLWFNDEATATSSVTLRYDNHNPPTPQPPKFYGGGYRNYMRMFRHPDTELAGVSIDEHLLQQNAIDTEYLSVLGLQSFGFLFDVPGGKSGEVVARFQHALKFDYLSPQSYQLSVLKQPGLSTNEYLIRVHAPRNVRVRVQRSGDLRVLPSNPTLGYSAELAGLIERDQTLIFTLSPR